MLDQGPGGRLGVTSRQAPRFLHVTSVHTHHGADLIGVRGRDAGAAQLACPARSAHPARRGPRLTGGVSDVDVASKANDKSKAEISKIGKQLVVAEAAIGQDGHPEAGRDNL